jgi:hypothetical protein
MLFFRLFIKTEHIYRMSDSGAKVVAFVSLLIVQVAVSLVYKFSQTNGRYSYSTISVITLAEIIKLCISLYLTFFWIILPPSEAFENSTLSYKYLFSKLVSYRLLAKQQLNRNFLIHTSVLALLYCINNQIAFILFQYIDLVTISLFKSLTIFQSAIILRVAFQRSINRVQWSAIILQVMGLIIVQYDICKKLPILEVKFYIILLVSCVITSICSVWNEYLLKNYTVNLHIQNSVLYFFGTFINLIIFIIFYNQVENYSKKFFEGYSMLSIAVIFCNSLLGLVITGVYKYADAIIKTFSTACATGVLIFVNWSLFGLPTNLITSLGAAIIFISSYIYFSAATVIIVPTTDLVVNNSHTIDTVVSLPTEEDVKCKIETKNCLSFRFLNIRLLVILGITVSVLIIPFIPLRQRLSLKLYLNSSSILNKPMIISLDDYQLNRPLVIHGRYLCPHNNNNSVQVLINSEKCSPIELCCDTVLSCRIERSVFHLPTLKEVNVSIIRTDSSNQRSLTSTMSVNLTRKFVSYWERNNIALVIHFNRNLYHRINFLKIYRDLFPTVIFTGPEQHSEVLHCPEGLNGFYAYSCLSRVIAQYPNHTGYLMSHFDVLPVFHKLERRDITCIWLPHIGLTDPSKTNTWHWPAPSGKRAFDLLFSDLNTLSRNNSLYSQYLANYIRNAGKNLTSSFSDIFYLPMRLVTDWLILTNLMLKHKLFLEIGFSAAMFLLTSTNTSKEVVLLNGENWSASDLVISLLDKSPIEYYHRIDHQSPLHHYFVEAIIKRSLVTSNAIP